VAGRSFAFDPDEITVRAGEAIAIVLSSEDDVHDFTIDDLDVHVASDAGSTSIGGLQVDDPGRHTFYCSVEGHREAGMEGTLVVEG
jgi:plastocyanin